MATITEDYVSFEIAKLLKEKGFKGQGEHFYENNKIINFTNYWYRITPKQRYEAIEAPTLQMTMKWLREVHNIHIVIKVVIRTYGDTEYYYELYGTKNKSLCVVCDIYKGETWDSSEKAVEAAIKYCCENLI